jgi:hypothetical protein
MIRYSSPCSRLAKVARLQPSGDIRELLWAGRHVPQGLRPGRMCLVALRAGLVGRLPAGGAVGAQGGGFGDLLRDAREPFPDGVVACPPRMVTQPGQFVADRLGPACDLIAEAQGEDSPVAPLFACLANEIRYEAALLGSHMPGGRLDPPLLMALDEVTQICPVPVPSWLADSGGKGIQIITVAHGEAQLRSRWGKDGARVILDTSGAKIWLPGVSDPDTLEMASKLCGTTGLKEARNWFGRRHDYHDVYARHPVMTPEMIRQLPDGCALVVRGGLSPVIARLPMAWKDPAYKSARRRGEAIAAVAAVPAHATQPTATPVPATTPHVGQAAQPDDQAPVPAGVTIKADGAQRANGNGAPQWPWQ